MEVLEDLIEADIDCIDPIDPRAGMDIEKVKKVYGNRVAIKGNVDCVETLTQKTENEVTREVLECISKAAFNGGYIISSSNTIHAGVNPANYKKMLEIVREYGTYPVNREKIEQVLDTIRE
jgi:uroporphyrinogen decarboxylase